MNFREGKMNDEVTVNGGYGGDGSGDSGGGGAKDDRLDASLNQKENQEPSSG